MTTTPPTEQQLDEITAIAARATDHPFYVSDCEGSLQVWREKALVRVRRDGSGQIEGYSFPSTYKVTDQVIELDLSTWDPGEDATDDQQRQDIRDLVEARAALGVLLAEIDCQRAQLAAAEAAVFAAVADELEGIDFHPDAKAVCTDLCRMLAYRFRRNAAPAPTSAPPAASHGPAGDRDGETGAEGAAGRVGDSRAPGIPQPVEDLAAIDNPTHLRWGLDDVLWSDDDSVIVLLSGPDLAPYWLELDPERAAVLRRNLAGPDAEQQAKARCRRDIETALGTYPCERDADHSGDCDERTEAEYAAAEEAAR